MMRNRLLILAVVTLFSGIAHAGLFELSATGNYRKTSVDEQNYSIVSSGTGGIAYYFWELSAFELAYTQGNSATIQPYSHVYTNFVMVQANILVTLAGKDDAFRPYVKIGGAYTIRTIRYEQFSPTPGIVFDPQVIKKEGLSPVAGVGFKLMLSQQFGLKGGIDAYTSALNETPVTYDYSGYAGISILF